MKESNRIRKNEIKYLITPNEEQKLAKKGAYEKDVTILLGEFGTAKTQTAVLIGLDLLFKKHIDKLYLTRPIDFKPTGYLTGTASEKLYFHILPLKICLYSAYGREAIDKLFAEGKIEIVPIDYMKGMTFVNACTIVDEFEDIPFEDFKMILTRLGKGSKLIFCGSEEQIDVKDSCIPKVKLLKDCPIVNYHTLTIQHRNDDIMQILNYIKQKENES